MLGNQKDAVAGKFFDEMLDIAVRGLGIDVEFGADRTVTISESDVRPSAACQTTVATGFRVKKVESTADMIIISPPSRREAMAELLAILRVFFRHYVVHRIKSQTRESGAKVRRRTGTRSTNSQAD